jgi:dihydroorotate dehydrogenase (fumarate)
MNLTTDYLGLTLKNPLITGASPLAFNVDQARRLEDAGIAAIVMNSLFEEQIYLENRAEAEQVEAFEQSFGEALSYLPHRDEFEFTPQKYLDHIAALKQAVKVPVIASLNGVSLGGWVEHARLMEQAGADAIELNYYDLPSDPLQTAEDVESRSVEILAAVKKNLKIPVAIKLSPFFTSLPHFTRRLVDFGVNGIVLFNRFYQPDINIEDLEVRPVLNLSDSGELNLRLRWLAILRATLETSFAVTGGVHTAEDVIKSIMAGASAVQLVSVLLKNGPGHVTKLLKEVNDWLDQHEYQSIEQICGSMSLATSPDPTGYERANYMRILQSWKS